MLVQHADNEFEGVSLRYRLALISGFAFGVLMFVKGFLFTPAEPDLGGSAQAIEDWLATSRIDWLISIYLEFAAGAFFLVFVAGLYVALRRAGDGSGLLALAAFGGGVATILVSIARLGVELAFVRVALDGGTPEMLRALGTVARSLQEGLAFPQGVFWATASIAILATRRLPRWIGILGAVGAVSLFVSTGTVFDPESPLGIFGFLVFPLFSIWMLATPVTLLRRSMTRQPAPQAQPLE
ncbi:DUF4386 family protein [Sphaerobacter sp.]|uniref:DUF4386 family protein n=1 Tax=Sphaerobacter sp. TaxID=2099654 RepID=UPI001D65EE7A|nr:DUF4386 family protein [Sphaerobacter sp.]MBX5445989.1 DUF4386 family protein [Sphaerobacter sp.]